MLYLHTTLTPIGELAMPEIECKHCNTKHLIMHFSHQRIESIIFGIDCKNPGYHVVCSHCGHETKNMAAALNKPFNQFYVANKHSFQSKFRFWLNWKFFVGVAAFILLIVVGSTISKKNDETHKALVEQHTSQPIVGDIFEIWLQNNLSNTAPGSNGVSRKQAWFKVIRINGDRIVMQKSEREYDISQSAHHENIDPTNDTFSTQEYTMIKSRYKWELESDKETHVSIWTVTPAK